MDLTYELIPLSEAGTPLHSRTDMRRTVVSFTKRRQAGILRFLSRSNPIAMAS